MVWVVLQEKQYQELPVIPSVPPYESELEFAFLSGEFSSCWNRRPAVRATSFVLLTSDNPVSVSYTGGSSANAYLVILVLLSALTSELGLCFLLCFVTIADVNMHLLEDFNLQSCEISYQQCFSHWPKWGMEADSRGLLLKFILQVLERSDPLPSSGLYQRNCNC